MSQILKLRGQPKKMVRHLQRVIEDPNSPHRIETNHLLGVFHWHENDPLMAVTVFKRTITMRYRIELCRLKELCRMLHLSEADDERLFAKQEFFGECVDRCLLENCVEDEYLFELTKHSMPEP